MSPEFLRIVRRVWAEVSRNPRLTIQELRSICGVSSTNVIHRACLELEACGYLRSPQNQGRARVVLVPFAMIAAPERRVRSPLRAEPAPAAGVVDVSLPVTYRGATYRQSGREVMSTIGGVARFYCSLGAWPTSQAARRIAADRHNSTRRAA